MDFTFLAVTFILVIFLFASYLLNVIRLSTPLILIYLIFCFTIIIDGDASNIRSYKPKDIANNNGKKVISEKVDLPNIETNKFDSGNSNKLEISKPVVSLNPKPIVIDTNSIIQNNEKTDVINNSEAQKTVPDLIKEDTEKINDPLKVNEIMICRGVYKRNPIKPGFEFANNVDSLFCYTKISNKGSKQEIKHLWYYENKLITSVTYNIKTSYNYRSWSKKTILPSQIGKWRVDIIDNKERILGSRKFEIKLLNNVF